MKIAIYLNKEHPEFLKLQEDLSKQLKALDTIKFKEESEPPKPGTLGIPGDVVAYVANHYKDVLLVATGIVNFLSYVEQRRAGRSKQPKKANASIFVLVVGDQMLKFPSSRQSQKRFLSKLKKEEKGKAR